GRRNIADEAAHAAGVIGAATGLGEEAANGLRGSAADLFGGAGTREQLKHDVGGADGDEPVVAGDDGESFAREHAGLGGVVLDVEAIAGHGLEVVDEVHGELAVQAGSAGDIEDVKLAGGCAAEIEGG